MILAPLQCFFIWISAMAWHLWRIATLRPAFKNLSDTGPMAMSFIFIYFFAGLLRWVVLNDDHKSTGISAVFGLLVWLILVFVCFERKNRSSALVASVLGVSALMDLLVCAGFLIGALESVRSPRLLGITLEIVWSLVMLAQFYREPEYVRLNGYRLAHVRKLNRFT